MLTSPDLSRLIIAWYIPNEVISLASQVASALNALMKNVVILFPKIYK
jgi:hypothetical protein